MNEINFLKRPHEDVPIPLPMEERTEKRVKLLTPPTPIPEAISLISASGFQYDRYLPPPAPIPSSSSPYIPPSGFVQDQSSGQISYARTLKAPTILTLKASSQKEVVPPNYLPPLKQVVLPNYVPPTNYNRNREKHEWNPSFSGSDTYESVEPFGDFRCSTLKIAHLSEPENPKEKQIVIKIPKQQWTRENEIRALSQLQGYPHFVQLSRIPANAPFQTSGIHMELLPPSLASRGRVTNFSELQTIGRQLLEALKILKEKGIIHTDLKPDNICYDLKTQRVKIIDFGLAQSVSVPAPDGFLSALSFRSPEAFARWRYQSCALDMWSLGVILYELATNEQLIKFPDNSQNKTIQLSNEYAFFSQMIQILGKLPPEPLRKNAQNPRVMQLFPFMQHTGHGWKPTDAFKLAALPRESLRQKITRLCPHFSEEQQSSFSDLLGKMLTWHPAARISPINALEHRFFGPRILPKLSFTDDDFKQN